LGERRIKPFSDPKKIFESCYEICTQELLVVGNAVAQVL
jgi:hypothetical protein